MLTFVSSVSAVVSEAVGASQAAGVPQVGLMQPPPGLENHNRSDAPPCVDGRLLDKANTRPDVRVMVLLAEPRTGSSLMSSLIAESADVLPLFELFNNLAHLNVFDSSLHETVTMWLRQDLAREDSPPLTTDELTNAIGDRPMDAVDSAIRLAQVRGQRWLSFKTFGNNCLGHFRPAMLRLAARSDVSMVHLRRNMFQSLTSEAKIKAGCEQYVGGNQTVASSCKVPIDIRELPDIFSDEVRRSACHMTLMEAAGGARRSTVVYHDLDVAPTMTAKHELAVRKCQQAANPHTFCASKPQKWRTADIYGTAQDAVKELSKKVSNYEQVRGFVASQKRSLCREAFHSAEWTDTIGGSEEELQKLTAWCVANPDFDVLD